MNDIVWRRSSRCGGGGNNCVELAEVDGRVGIRDNVFPSRVVSVDRRALPAFLAWIPIDSGAPAERP